MEYMSHLLQSWLTIERISQIIRVALILAIGIPFIKIAGKLIIRMFKARLNKQSEMLVQKIIYYSGIAIIFISVLNELGFKLSALLGAAGVIGVALGFASQTSISNIISGIFLISEKPFSVGDTIKIGATSGVILSIDLLSVKLRTADNRFVRIPNEAIIKSEITNLSRYPIRRLDTTIRLSISNNPKHVMEMMKEVAFTIADVLHEPSPSVSFLSIVDAKEEFILSVWVTQEDMSGVQNNLLIRLTEIFKSTGIEFV